MLGLNEGLSLSVCFESIWFKQDIHKAGIDEECMKYDGIKDVDICQFTFLYI